MNRHRHIPLVTVLLAGSALVGACGGSSGPLGSVPIASASAGPSVALGSPDATPSEEPSTGPSEEPTGSTNPGASTTPTPAPSGTTIVRAYFWLSGLPGSEGPVAVLRTIPATKAVATAAVSALLAGPTTAETGRSITTAIPGGTQLLDLAIDKSVATVNLSAEFVGGGDSAAVQTRLAQVTYTLTQFPTVKSVIFQIEGVQLADAVTRATYVALLPDIWVDRPAFNAAIGNPAHVTGNANVFEATFRMSILDASGKVIADVQVMATCGTGCPGTFDTTIPYTVSKGQYGILRAYNPSAKDGTPESIRDYRVWLTPKG
ncbi:MAG TPA: GerMN domain-containing protein [Candidatus Limnocylindrales bacterium]|nr:GerMN domain-containing protein [Candidatus Limnocylindrales bacterium]